jgi:hypothetical protein
MSKGIFVLILIFAFTAQASDWTERLPNKSRTAGWNLNNLSSCDDEQAKKSGLCREDEEMICEPNCHFFRDINNKAKPYCAYCDADAGGGDSYSADGCYENPQQRIDAIQKLMRKSMQAAGCFAEK